LPRSWRIRTAGERAERSGAERSGTERGARGFDEDEKYASHYKLTQILFFASNYTTRIFFDLSFFLILGVLLFDMVTGIILDTFGSLREEVAEREGILKDCTFISGLTREYIEELGEGLNFDKINKVDQELWNYFFFVMYIKDTPVQEMNGAEAYVHECLRERDTNWIPCHTCCAIEENGVVEGTEEMVKEEEENNWKKGIEESLGVIKNMLVGLMVTGAGRGVGD